MKTAIAQVLYKFNKNYTRPGYTQSIKIDSDGCYTIEWKRIVHLNSVTWIRHDNQVICSTLDPSHIITKNGITYSAEVILSVPYNDNIELLHKQIKYNNEDVYMAIIRDIEPIDRSDRDNHTIKVQVFCNNKDYTKIDCFEEKQPPLGFILTCYAYDTIPFDLRMAVSRVENQESTIFVPITREDWQKTVETDPITKKTSRVYVLRHSILTESDIVITKASLNFCNDYNCLGIIEGNSVCVRFKDCKPPRKGVLEITYKKKG